MNVAGGIWVKECSFTQLHIPTRMLWTTKVVVAEFHSDDAYFSWYGGGVSSGGESCREGLSIRCVKDE